MPCPEKFKESLLLFRVDPSIAGRILDGYEDLVSSSPKTRRAAFFSRAASILDEGLGWQDRRELMEFNACCKGGQRANVIKEFVADNSSLSLAEKITALVDVPNMGRPYLHADGTIIAHIDYLVDGKFHCPCPNFHQLKITERISSTYCLCCAGHFRHHYQKALGIRLETKEIVSSPLESGGKRPCVIAFTQI